MSAPQCQSAPLARAGCRHTATGEALPTAPLDRLILLRLSHLLNAALETEFEHFRARHATLRDGRGRPVVVRNGHLPARSLQTALGAIEVHAPKTRVRGPARLMFRSQIIPRYVHHLDSVNADLRWTFLDGVERQDLRHTLAVLVGSDALEAVAGSLGLSAQSLQQVTCATCPKGGCPLTAHRLRAEVVGDAERRRLKAVLIAVPERGPPRLLALKEATAQSRELWQGLLDSLGADIVASARAIEAGEGVRHLPFAD